MSIWKFIIGGMGSNWQTEDGRQETEVRLTLAPAKTYDAFVK